MKCSEVQENMMDILYGEVLDSRTCFEFYSHLDECHDCRTEYGELVETRRMMSEWEIEANYRANDPSPGGKGRQGNGSGWHSFVSWRFVQRAAAVVLMILGGWALIERAVTQATAEIRLDRQDLHQLVTDIVEDKMLPERVQIYRRMTVGFEELDHQLKYNLVPDMGLQVYNRLHSRLKESVAVPDEKLERVEGH